MIHVDAPSARGVVRRLGSMVLTVTAITIAAEIMVRVLRPPTYIVAAPSEILRALVEIGPLLLQNSAVTLFEAFSGFLMGMASALLAATLAVRFAQIERVLMPAAAALQTVPIVVLTPLLVLAFGNGLTPKIVVAALICFFPVLVSAVRGLRSIDLDHLALFRMMKASSTQELWLLRWPTSLPYVFSAARIASANCVIGAILGEWLGADRGVGFMITIYLFQIETAKLYATVLTSSMLGILLYLIVRSAERLLIHRSMEV